MTVAARLMFLRLELKRACKRLPQVYAGAAILLALMGTAAFLAGRLLYGEAVTGRAAVGVAVPGDDAAAAKVISMVGSLESVKSLCDFEFGEFEECMDRMGRGELSAVMDVPKGFVRDIMNGVNTPVRIYLPADAGIEGRVFAELARAGASTLSSSQAGIYAADELCTRYGMPGSIPVIEADLNQLYLSYSLPRMDYFRKVRVKATGDVDSMAFYGISFAALSLLLCAIPVSSYLKKDSAAMRRKLALAGVGPATVVGSRIAGLALLMAGLVLPAALAARGLGWLSGETPGICAVGLLLLACLAAAGFVMAVYRLAGTLMGGVMLLFLLAVGLHLLSGGFLPAVFLPACVRRISWLLPPAALMDSFKMLVTGEFDAGVLMRLLALAAAGFLFSLVGEVRGE